MQRVTEKFLVTESRIKKTNKNGMGNKVGIITNYVTSMMEVQSRFEKGSDEYNILEYRIECGQLIQQDELDRIKGIIAKPMPKSWYNLSACKKDEKLRSLCANKKPYFMIYIYDELKRKYKKFIKERESKCMTLYNCTLDELKKKEFLNDEQLEFLKWNDILVPVGIGPCCMNKICWYIEDQFNGYKASLIANSDFDYSVLKVKRRCTEEHREQLRELEKQYCECVEEYKRLKSIGHEEANNGRHSLYEKFNAAAKEICPNDEERLNIILDITYGYKGNRQFCWDTIGELICKRLEDIQCSF